MTYQQRICTNCNETYTPRRHDQVNCSKACTNDANNRELMRGKAIYRALYYWLANPKDEHSGSAMGMVSKQMRAWIKEDREKGHQAPPPPYDIRTRQLNASYTERLKEVRKHLDALPMSGADGRAL